LLNSIRAVKTCLKTTISSDWNLMRRCNKRVSSGTDLINHNIKGETSNGRDQDSKD